MQNVTTGNHDSCLYVDFNDIRRNQISKRSLDPGGAATPALLIYLVIKELSMFIKILILILLCINLGFNIYFLCRGKK